ncbi:Uncharacterised protein [Mycobacteroides abscessus subsp. abscessus]|nr:Uncharacterised protein [Mycobacteroides abscessus subsp. abscessus]
MVEQVLADVPRIHNHRDPMFGQLSGRANAAEHQQLGAFENALGENDFPGGVKVVLITETVDDRHAFGRTGGVVDDEAFGAHLREDRDVRLALYEEVAARAHTFVDAVDRVGKAVHLAVEDVVG